MTARQLFQKVRPAISAYMDSVGATTQEKRILLRRVAASLRSAERACKDVHGPKRECAILFWAGTDLGGLWHSDSSKTVH